MIPSFPRILVAAPFYQDFLHELEKNYSITYQPKISQQQLIEQISSYHILITSTQPAIDQAVLKQAQKMKLIMRLGIGVDHIDLNYCQKLKIKVCNTPRSNILPVVELVFSQLIRVLRQLDAAQANLYQGKFRQNLILGDELSGKKIGVIGTGRIGSKICELAGFFKMNVVSYDPYLSRSKRKKIKTNQWADWKELIMTSDIITLHVPLTAETRHLVDYHFLKRMKENSILINTSRGKVVCFNDVIQFLKQGRQARFIFDVFENEPYIPALEPCFQPYLFFTPHIGANTNSSLKKRSQECLVQLRDYMQKKKPHGIINLKRGY